MKRRTFLRGLGTAAAFSATGCSRMSNHNKSYKPVVTVPKRTFGNTGMEVSLLGFGSHLIKDLIKKPKLRDRMIKLGYESGINTFDVYDHHGYKQFEPMSKSIRDFRKEILVSLVAVKKTEDMQSEVDSALTTFHTDYIDLYRNHQIDDERMAILEKSKKEGKIRKIGVVSHDAGKMSGYLDDYGGMLDFVMIIYNFHHHMGRPKGGETWPWNSYEALIPRCRRMNLGILGIKPMGSDDMTALAEQKGFFKDKRGNIAQSMLRHVYEAPEIHCSMPAMNSMKELITNLESVSRQNLTSPERSMLADLSGEADALKGAYLRPHYRWLENWACGARAMTHNSRG
ncbi:aldo/keto reductase [Candidatus Latescibacterota bacterium]